MILKTMNFKKANPSWFIIDFDDISIENDQDDRMSTGSERKVCPF